MDGRKILTELNPKQYFNNARSSWLRRQQRKKTRGKSPPESIKTNALKPVDLGFKKKEKKEQALNIIPMPFVAALSS